MYVSSTSDGYKNVHKLTDNQTLWKGIGALLIATAVFWIGYLLGTGGLETPIKQEMRGFTLILWSILLEALPFVLLGVLISSLIQVFVTEDMILRLMPGNSFLRLLFASLIGLVFPVCECAIIPITRGLLKKGMPTGPAIAFMLATPIVNPIVILSTINAFPSMPGMALLRAVCGLIGAIAIGALASKADRRSVLKNESPPPSGCEPQHGHAACAYGADHDGEAEHGCCDDPDGKAGHLCGANHDGEAEHGHIHGRRGKQNAFLEVLRHTNAELRSVGAYLIFGAVIAAAVQTSVPTEVLTSIGGGRVLSIAVMMLLAFVLSLCSEADAFVASTFILQFSGASVLAFLIVGPMIDIKNTFMLFGSFQKRFAARLIAMIILVCFAIALTISFFLGGRYA